MKLISPQSLWFLLTIPLLIMMYILKQKFEEKEISSLYLWQQVIVDMEASTPWQRLRKNLLFFIQLLILLLLIFSLTNPFVYFKGAQFENVILVLDNSGSMSAVYENSNRLQEAKNRVEKLVASMSPKSKITLISSNKNSKVEVSGSSDKQEIIKKVKEINATNSSGDINNSYSLVKAISRQYDSYKVIYFTDSAVDLKDLNGEVNSVSSKRDNFSLDYISHSLTSEGLKVMIRVTNRSENKGNTEIGLYGDGKLLDIKTIELGQGETKTIYFNNIVPKYQYIHGEITEKDGLNEDNIIYSVVKQNSTQRIMLVTEKNVFLEKALATLKNVELFKANEKDNIVGEYDLYIFDGVTPENIPKKGNILYINPKGNTGLFNLGDEVQGGSVEVQLNAVTKYMSNTDFVVSKFHPIQMPYWGSALLKINGETTSFLGETKGRRVAAISFDFHNTDFPLTPEFPIFINNIIGYLANGNFLSKTQYFCGDIIDILPMADTESLLVKNPKGETSGIDIKSTTRVYDNTYTPGIYEILEKNSEGEISNILAVNFPVSESDINNEAENITSKNKDSLSNSGYNIQNYLVALAFAFVLIEWLVYLKMYGRNKSY